MSSRFVSSLFVVASAVCAVPVLAPAVASAQPGTGPLIHTTCSYEQLYAAIRAEAPNAAAELDQRPAAQQKLRDVAAMSVDERQQKLSQALADNPHWQAAIDEKWDTPQGQEKRATLARIAEVCHGY
ncbi:MAG: hemophore-related protein [Actinomycetota bacterium]|nr:hemophore-related protein [Actinomycetota bacterium]